MLFHKDADMDEMPKSRSKENDTAKEKAEKKEEESKKVEEVPDNQKQVCVHQGIVQGFAVFLHVQILEWLTLISGNLS